MVHVTRRGTVSDLLNIFTISTVYYSFCSVAVVKSIVREISVDALWPDLFVVNLQNWR